MTPEIPAVFSRARPTIMVSVHIGLTGEHSIRGSNPYFKEMYILP